MKNKRLGLLSVSVSMVAALFAGTYFANENDSIECGAIPVEVPESKYNPVFYPADYSTSITNEPQYSTQRDLTFNHMGFSKAPSSYRGDSVKVAVIDSGLNYTHEDFGTINGVSGAIDNKSGSWTYYKYGLGYQSRINDTLGHGTNVASVIASQINQLGCAGIAPNVDLYVFKVTNDNNGYEWTAINSALQYCLDNNVKVINMSFQAYEHAVSYGSSSIGASTGCSTVLTTKLNACYNAGITLVGAAGNYNTNEPSYPASNNHVISVGSLAENSTTSKAGFSNTYGIDLVAPGYVYTADKGTNSSYKKTSGTSFSAPIVTAAIALYKQKNPNATPAQIESALYASCDAVSGNPSWAGHGRLNVDKFLGLDENSPSSISITNVSEKKIELEVGETFQIEHSITPSTFTGGVEYTTYDTGSISVSDSGLITALAEGEDTVSVSCKGYDNVYDEVDVIVKAKTVIEEQTETYNIVFGNTSGSNEITSSDGFKNVLSEGKDCVSSFSDFSKVYNDSKKLKIGSGSAVGKFTINFNDSISALKCKLITLTASKYSSDTGDIKLSANSSLVETFKTTAESKTHVFDEPTNVSSIKIETTAKRAYISGVSLECIKAGSTPVTPTLNEISVSNLHRTFAYGASFVKETVTATYSNGSYVDVTNEASFSGYNLNSQGNQTITVSYGGKQTTYTITVSAPTPTVTSVTISGATNNQNLTVGDTLKLSATVNGMNSPSQSVTWSSSNNSYATVSSNGTVTAVGAGSVTITAKSVANANIKGTVILVIVKQETPSTDSYYKNANASSMSTLQSSLHTIISSGTVDVGYDGLFNAYKTTDVKPGTNYLWDMYSNVDYTTTDSRINASYSGEGDSINREHTIPQSWFNEASPMKADLFHVYPTDGYVNNRRSNYPHGDVTNASYTSNNGSKLGTGNNTAVNNLLGSDKKLFEVVDDYKGDFARSYFYFATRYSDKISSFTTDGKRMFKTTAPFMNDSFIDMYYAWHIADPVSQKEIDRNNAVYVIQKNRNPYIDHPEWVAIAFGTDTPSTVDVAGVSLDQTSLQLNVGESATLTATVAPSNATNKDVTWQSSDTSVATVSGGVVTAVSAGNATITVKTVDGNKTATCAVTVKSSGSTGGTEKTISITRNSFSESGGYAWYDWSQDGVEGQAYIYSTTSTSMQFNGGKGGYALFSTTTLGNIKSVTVKASNSDRSWTLYGSQDPYTTTTTTSGTEIGTATTNGDTGITFTPTENYKFFSLSLNATNAAYLTSIDVVYVEGGSTPVDPEIKGITLSETSKSIDLYSDSKTFTLTPTVSFVGEIDTTVLWTTSDSSVASISANKSANGTAITVTANKVGSAAITAICGEKSATCSVTITDSTDAKTVVDLEIIPEKEKISFMEGEGEVTISATVKAVYKDGHKEPVDSTANNFKINTASLGDKIISASYAGITKEKTVKVTNNGADVGETTTSVQKTSINHSFTSSNMSSSLPSGWTATTSGTTGYDTGGRGVQLQKNAGCTIKSSSLENITSIDLYVAKSSSGKGSFTIAIGGTTVKTISTFNTTSTKVSATLDEAMDGVVEIKGSASASSIYIKQFTVNCEIQTGVSHNATAPEQAKAWSQYFLDLTSPICSANSNGDNGESLLDVWGELSSEYNYMIGDSKSEFLSSNDSTITAARERYMHIASHYGVDIENFTKTQFANNKGINLFENLNVLDGEHPATFLTIVLSLVGVASIGGYFIVKKRKEI